MKNIFYTLVFASFINSSYVLSMKNQIDSLEEIKSISVQDGMNLAYLSDNKLLVTVKNENAIRIFNVDNEEQKFFPMPESVGRIIIEPDIYGKNVYLAHKHCSNGDGWKNFFYSGEKEEIVTRVSQGSYRCMSRQKPDYYLSQSDGKMFEGNIVQDFQQECSVLNSFFERKRNLCLHTFCPQTNQIIYRPYSILNQNLYWCDLADSAEEKFIGFPEYFYISPDETFFLVQHNGVVCWKDLIHPYQSGSLRKDVYSNAFGAAITPNNRIVIIVAGDSIQFWDIQTRTCISSVEIKNKSFSRAGQVISISPDGKAFAIFSSTECNVYKMPFIIKNFHYISHFALLQFLLNTKNKLFPLPQEILDIFKRYLVI
jgi:WD40 repeat protein